MHCKKTNLLRSKERNLKLLFFVFSFVFLGQFVLGQEKNSQVKLLDNLVWNQVDEKNVSIKLPAFLYNIEDESDVKEGDYYVYKVKGFFAPEEGVAVSSYLNKLNEPPHKNPFSLIKHILTARKEGNLTKLRELSDKKRKDFYDKIAKKDSTKQRYLTMMQSTEEISVLMGLRYKGGYQIFARFQYKERKEKVGSLFLKEIDGKWYYSRLKISTPGMISNIDNFLELYPPIALVDVKKGPKKPELKLTHWKEELLTIRIPDDLPGGVIVDENNRKGNYFEYEVKGFIKRQGEEVISASKTNISEPHSSPYSILKQYMFAVSNKSLKDIVNLYTEKENSRSWAKKFKYSNKQGKMNEKFSSISKIHVLAGIQYNYIYFLLVKFVRNNKDNRYGTFTIRKERDGWYLYPDEGHQHALISNILKYIRQGKGKSVTDLVVD